MEKSCVRNALLLCSFCLISTVITGCDKHDNSASSQQTSPDDRCNAYCQLQKRRAEAREKYFRKLGIDDRSAKPAGKH